MEHESFESTVMELVAERAPVSFDELQRFFHGHSWNRLFAVADRLSRNGLLVIRRTDRGKYLLAVGPAYRTGTDHRRPVPSDSLPSA